MRVTTIFLIFFIPGTIFSFAQSQTDTLKLYYEIDKRELTADHTQKLDSIINRINKKSLAIQIIGYADYLASNEYNIGLSSKRAEIVKDYLISKGVNKELIVKCEGKGEMPDENNSGAKGVQEHRRVEVVFLSEKKKAKGHPGLIENNRPKANNKTIEKIGGLKKGETLVLKNLNFIGGSAELLSESLPVLEDLLKTMNKYPFLKIEIQGHICCVSLNEESFNSLEELSIDRAKTVYDYLVNNGISEDRLGYKGFGSRKKLVDPEITEEDRVKNRRVEIMVIENDGDSDKTENIGENGEKPLPKQSKTIEEIGTLQKGETLALKDLNFIPGRHVLTKKSIPEMEKLLEVMKQNPTLKIQIQGHICCEMTQDGYDFDTGENTLSVNRAKFVFDYLVSKGINRNRLSYKGFGRSRPLVNPEMSEEDSNKNRRVEILIVDK